MYVNMFLKVWQLKMYSAARFQLSINSPNRIVNLFVLFMWSNLVFSVECFCLNLGKYLGRTGWRFMYSVRKCSSVSTFFFFAEMAEALLYEESWFFVSARLDGQAVVTESVLCQQGSSHSLPHLLHTIC